MLHTAPKLTPAHALRTQMQSQRSHLALQIRPAQLAMPAQLVAADDGRHARCMRGLHMAQHLVRIVGLCAGKPLRARHDIAGQHGAVGRGGLHVEVVPDALPEGIQIGRGPAPEGVIVIKRQAAGLLQPLLVQAYLRNKRGGGRRLYVVHAVRLAPQLSGVIGAVPIGGLRLDTGAGSPASAQLRVRRDNRGCFHRRLSTASRPARIPCLSCPSECCLSFPR